MASQVHIDRQGRLVIPLRERERLGLTSGGTLELVAVPEGILLETRRRVEIRKGDDGLPIAVFPDSEMVSNDDAVAAIHDEREQR